MVSPHRHLDQHELAHVLEYFMDVHRFVPRQLVRSDHPVHQVTQPVGLVDDDTRVFLEFFSRQLLFEQLRRAAQTAKRVLDFVRESAHHRAVRGLAVEHALVARQAQQPINLGKLDEKLVAARAVGQRRDRTVHGDSARSRQQQPHAAGSERVAAGERLLERFYQAQAVREQTGERLADHFLLLTSNSISPAGLIDVSRSAPSKVSTAVVRLSSMDCDGPWLMLISVGSVDPVFKVIPVPTRFSLTTNILGVRAILLPITSTH